MKFLYKEIFFRFNRFNSILYSWLFPILVGINFISCQKKQDFDAGKFNYKEVCDAKVFDELIDGSHEIKFYPSDTVNFILDISKYDSVFVAINCLDIYDTKCWSRYYGDKIKLTNRTKEPNGWADGPFSRNVSKEVFKWISFNEKAKRNNLNKFNVLRFQFFVDSSHYEQIYHLGVGMSPPSNHIAMVDYERLEDMVGDKGNYGPGAGYYGFSKAFKRKIAIQNNYQLGSNKDPAYINSEMSRCLIEKPAVFSLYSPSGNAIIQQHIGIKLSADGSAVYPLKGLQVNARKEYGESRMIAPLFGTSESFKNVRLRMGGTSQLTPPCNQLMDVVGHDLYGERGMRNVFVSLFMNGYQWGVGYMQEKFDEHYIEKYYGYNHEFVDVVEIIGQSNSGILCIDTANSHKMDKEGKLESLGFHNYLSYDENYCWLASVKDGDGRAFGEFYKQAMSGDFSHLDLESTFDYLIQADFLMLGDMGRNNTIFWCDDRRDPMWHAQGMDFDYILIDNPNRNHWDVIFKPEDKDPFREIIRKLFEKPEIIQQFLTRYFDLLNTLYSPDVTIPKVKLRLEEFSKEVYNHEYAWAPNSLKADEWMANCYEYSFFEPFLSQRNFYVKAHLVSRFMEGRFAKQDLHTIEIDYPDNLELGEDFYIQFNSLKLNKDFKGTYLPFPEIRIKLENLPDNYEFVGWEGIESTTVPALKITLVKDIKLKPIFRKIH